MPQNDEIIAQSQTFLKEDMYISSRYREKPIVNKEKMQVRFDG